MHAVSLDPPAVTIQPGGNPVAQIATVTDVPADFTINQVLSFAVGVTNVDVGVDVTVDRPQPTATGTPADAAYTLTFATPVQDEITPSTWTVVITYTPVS